MFWVCFKNSRKKKKKRRRGGKEGGPRMTKNDKVLITVGAGVMSTLDIHNFVLSAFRVFDIFHNKIKNFLARKCHIPLQRERAAGE